MSMRTDISRNRVFISYAREDEATALRLNIDLRSAGILTWIDKHDLPPGSDWKESIRSAIELSSFVIVLLSSRSIEKRGFVQQEFRFALEVLEKCPPSEVFLIPVRIEPCEPAYRRLKDLQWLDLFPSYDAAVRVLIRSLKLPDSTTAQREAKEFSLASVQSLVGLSRQTRVAIRSIPHPKDQYPLVLRGKTREVPSVVLNRGETVEVTVRSGRYDFYLDHRGVLERFKGMDVDRSYVKSNVVEKELLPGTYEFICIFEPPGIFDHLSGFSNGRYRVEQLGDHKPWPMLSDLGL